MLTDPDRALRTRRRCAVVIGTMTVLSWSCPTEDCPLAARTPTTSNGIRLMRMLSPTGSSVPKSSAATVWPMTQTLAALRSSSSSRRRPKRAEKSRIRKNSAVVPVTCEGQFRFSRMSCVPTLTCGATSPTDQHSSRIAATSESVRGAPLPEPWRTPPERPAPDVRMIMLLPIPEISPSI